MFIVKLANIRNIEKMSKNTHKQKYPNAWRCIAGKNGTVKAIPKSYVS
jgi:hypothetical protein